MSRKLTLFIFSILLALPSFGQRITVGPGNLQNINIVGPFASDNNKSYSSFAYIYPELSLPGILHMDTIEAIDFQRNGPNGSIPGRCKVKIWLQNTSSQDFGTANINFMAERLNISAQLVFDGDANNIIDSTNGFKKFSLQQKYAYDTSLGKNLAMFVEYEQDSFPAASIFWNSDNIFAVPSFANNQVKFARDTALIPTTSTGSSSIHPQIRLDIPRADYEGNILIPYTYGKLPVPLGNPDTIKLRVINLGKKDATGVKIFVRSRGANEFIDSVITDMPRFRDTIISFPTRSISNMGMDTLTFELPPDSSLPNNTREHVREATLDVYSYRIVSEPLAPGGIGFNGSTGNFVCKFASNDKKLINQIEVNFGIINRPFKVGIWDYDSSTGQPGNLLWESDSFTSSNTSTIPIFPLVEVDGNFFAGVRQLGTLNVSFGYQLESPVRPQTFWYSAPLASTNWIDFAPAAPFRFAIEPRTQAEFDVMAFEAVSPQPNEIFDLFDLDTIRPSANFYNLGASDMDTLIPFKYEMYIGNFKVLDLVKWDSISSGSIKTIVFDTAFVPEFSGNYRVISYPLWDKDSVSLNDSLEYEFVVAVFDDVNMEFIFSPQNNAVLEFKRDTITPLFRIRNSAFNVARNFWSKLTITGNKTGLVYADSIFTASLSPANSLILGTSSWPANFIDTFRLVFTTELPNDAIKRLDTIVRTIIVRKTIDIKTDSIFHPALNIAYANNNPLPKPQIRFKNEGQGSPLSSLFYIEIRNSSNVLIHKDSIQNLLNIFPGSSLLASFPANVNISKRGVYSVLAYHQTDNDFETIQDSISGIFFYGFERDAQADSILNPTNLIEFELGEGSFIASGKVSNQGFDSMRNTAVKMEGRDSLGNLFYISGRTVTLDSNESETVVFDNVIFNRAGKVQLQLITLLPQDQNAPNDTITKEYMVNVSNDVGVDSIYNFSAMQRIRAQSVFKPSALITNYGKEAQNSPFPVNYEIENSSGTVVYDQTENTSLDSAESKVFTFSTTYFLEDTGAYAVEARTLLGSDQVLPNDLLSQNFEVYIGSNTLISDSFPMKDVRYPPHVSSTNRVPVIRLSKNGESPVPDSGKVYVSINAVNKSYNYLDSVAYTFVGNSDTLINMNIPFSSDIRDSFRAKIWLSSNENDLLEDDEREFGFSVDFGTSVPSVSTNEISVSPNPSEGIFALNTPEKWIGNAYSIFNTDGKKVLDGNLKTSQDIINLQYLPAGAYFLHLNELKIKLVKIK